MRPTRQTTRSLAVLLTAGALALGLTASAGAVIYVYANGFFSKDSVTEVKRSGGGQKCDKRFRDKSNSMAVSVVGKRLCEFAPPVVGDAAQPNHVVWAKGKVLPKKTPKALRDDAYLSVKVRAGRGDYYELQVRPKGGRWKLIRSPASGGFADEGQSSAINAPKQPNALRLMVKGARVTAFVNGDQLISVVDPNPQGVEGRRVAFGLGSRRDSSRAIVGAFDRIRVGIAN